MTTESQQDPRTSVAPVLLGGAAVSVGAGLVLAGLGAVVAGAPAAYGAAVGAGLVVVVFALGSLAVDAVATVAPGLALVVALTTYLLQVVLTGVGFLALDRSGALGETLAAGWVAAGAVVGTLSWVVLQIALTTRLRIPAYALTAAAPSGADDHRTPASGAARAGDR
ncbi:hypothetical protein [Nocardioides kribbensis]|uniref:ATP synthase protein I n=1 Tax=Nocardioides kribbensis TaxID=305517 RepID=A0ABV1NWR2_9ACTN